MWKVEDAAYEARTMFLEASGCNPAIEKRFKESDNDTGLEAERLNEVPVGCYCSSGVQLPAGKASRDDSGELGVVSEVSFKEGVDS